MREDDRVISVMVKGRVKTNYLTHLRKTLNAIFNSYKSEKPELQYRIDHFGQIPEEKQREKALWVQDEEIVHYVTNEIPYHDYKTGRDIPMGQPVTLYNIKIENMISGQGHHFQKGNPEKPVNPDPPKKWYKNAWIVLAAIVSLLSGLGGILKFVGFENWGNLLEQLKDIF